MQPVPLAFVPILKKKIWGGDQLRIVARRPIPPGACIGESWEISDRPREMSVVSDGPLAGRTLRDLMHTERGDLLGESMNRTHKGPFPILVKLIDTAAPLSVQVHPDDAYAAREGLREPGKSEAWYVLHAVPGAVIYLGLRPEVTREMLFHCLSEGRIGEAMQRLDVTAGDTIYCPAGTVHALGAGLVLVEIQHNSDVTYRIYDWGRQVGGNSRSLQPQQALEAIRFGVSPLGKLTPAPMADSPFYCEQLLPPVAGVKFTLQRWYLRGNVRCRGNDDVSILTVVAGSGEICGQGFARRLLVGDTLLLPACLRDYEIQAKPELRLLRTMLTQG